MKFYNVLVYTLLFGIFTVGLGCSKPKRENALQYAEKLVQWGQTPEYAKMYIEDAQNKTNLIKSKELELAISCGFESREDLENTEEALRNDKDYLNLKLEYIGIQMALETKIELNLQR